MLVLYKFILLKDALLQSLLQFVLTNFQNCGKHAIYT